MNWQAFIDLDARLSRRLHLDQTNGRAGRLAALLAHSGDSWFWVAGLGLIWLFGDPAWRARAALLGFGVCALALIVLAIKFSIKRPRPEGEWGAIYRNTDPHSFPSGHAARAFMLAVVALGVGPTWFGIALLIWAPLVSLARVFMRVHYVLDVVAGALLGIVAGVGVLAVHPLLVRLIPFIF